MPTKPPIAEKNIEENDNSPEPHNNGVKPPANVPTVIPIHISFFESIPLF